MSRRLNILILAGIIAVLIGGWLFFNQPTASYTGYITPDLGDQAGGVSTQCISPWDRWTHHYGTDGLSIQRFVQYDQLAGAAACNKVINSREQVSWILVVIGGVVAAGSFLQRKRSQASDTVSTGL
jgi:hypothetical protein